jgi:periplasmic divalent cation tolerance protein
MMPEPCLVITSWPDLDSARLQARQWVGKKLATSVNVLPQMDSIYRWKGDIRDGREHKIFVKTSSDRLVTPHDEIKSAHPYAVAEIISFKIDSGDADYLDWITTSTR